MGLTRRDFLKLFGLLPAVPVVGKLDKFIPQPEPEPVETPYTITATTPPDDAVLIEHDGYYMVTAYAFLEGDAYNSRLTICKNGEPIASQMGVGDIRIAHVVYRKPADVFEAKIIQSAGGRIANKETPIDFRSIRIT